MDFYSQVNGMQDNISSEDREQLRSRFAINNRIDLRTE